MGISAVPGAGKTFTLSLLAAELVTRLAQEGRLDEQEVLVVTFTNSAAENFRTRINQFIAQRGLLPGAGYRVRTLHGLAHDIVRERPGLVGLSEEFTIVDERATRGILESAVNAYLSSHPDFWGAFLTPDYLANPARVQRYMHDDSLELAASAIRLIKEFGNVTPAHLRNTLSRQSGYWPLLHFAIEIYESYARGLQVRGGVDFDDLIVLALEALRADEGFLARLQRRWPYVLEDEAQDSSLLQEKMLSLLTAQSQNWVRVGDPNQAINTTFTSADPRFLRRFVARGDVADRPLPQSGRSARPIIDLANFLSDWSRTQHPEVPPELALSLPHIQPTGPEDPQPNPPPGEPCVVVYDRALTPEKELQVTVESLQRWLPQNPTQSVAVLVPDNGRGFALVQALEKTELAYDDSLLRSSASTRAAAHALAQILLYISKPEVPTHLQKLWEEVWWPRKGRPMVADGPAPRHEELPEPVQTFGRALSRANLPERFLFPLGGEDWLADLPWLDEAEGFRPVAEAFRGDLRRWVEATILPVDELTLTLGNDLFNDPSDLALTHSIALLLTRRAREMPDLRLPELAHQLREIAQNQGRLLGFDENAVGFEPSPGVITVATMHSAKGLEWDRVYLLAVSDYSFPSGGEGSNYRGERWFVRDGLNLRAELEAQLQQLHMGTLDEYEPGRASRQNRLDVAAERLRLLYVAITRARRELIVLYNTGRSENRPNAPALAFSAMAEYVGA